MATWKDYAPAGDPNHHGVVGRIKQLEQLHSPQLGNRRDLLVYLPPSYGTGERRFPVIYMHDGQNLFDPATSFAGEWKVDQTLEAASLQGLEVIVVAVPNMGPERIHEYGPFVDSEHGGGKAELYLRFLTETVKPLVDADFCTLTGREHTGVAGSSMGGLISLFAFFARPQVFGFAGVMSPSLWFANRAVLDWVAGKPHAGGRVYIDVGLREGERTVADVLRLRDLLEAKGYRNLDDLLCVVDTAGDHSERAWARRLHRQLRFLLGLPRTTARARAGPRE